MANDIRNDLLLYGPHDLVDSVVGAFLRDGFNAHAPVSGANSPSEMAGLSKSRWGCYGLRGPDVLVQTRTSIGLHIIAPLEDWENSKTYAKNGDTDLDRFINGGKLAIDAYSAHIFNHGYEGIEPPQPGDGMARLKFYTPWSPPSDWIASVMDQYYKAGLRVTLEYFDLSNTLGPVLEITGTFWSVAAPAILQMSDFRLSDHCAGCQNSDLRAT